jgi:hypothetical protein
MLALDEDECEEIVEEYLENHSTAELYDEVFIPALSRAKNDRRHGQLSERDEQAVYDGTRTVLEDLGDRRENGEPANQNSPLKTVAPKQIVATVGFPADGKADEVALLLFQKILDPQHYQMEVISADMLASEMFSLVGEKQPRLVCIGAIAPGGLARARYLCKRLRNRFPEVKILVGRWGASDSAGNARTSLSSAGADRVAATLFEARDQLAQLIHLQTGAAIAAR